MVGVSAAGEISEDYCQIEVDTSKQQGFLSDSDVFPAFTSSPDKSLECVWIMHAPIGARVSFHSHFWFSFCVIYSRSFSVVYACFSV